MRQGELSWTWEDGLGETFKSGFGKVHTGGWLGLTAITLVAGLVAGVAEALGA